MSASKATRTGEVYEVLRADILNTRIEPGSKLKIAQLSNRFGVSLSVVREALTRLGEQRLVVANPQRGFSVVGLSVSDLDDLTNVRTQIESMALRDSIAHGGVAWEAEVVAALHRLERTEIYADPAHVNPEWLDLHRAYHHSLVAGGASTRLRAIANTLRDNAELYRMWSRTWAHDVDRDLQAEHRAIMAAALSGDEEAAVAALSQHIARTTAALKALVTSGESDA
ncbi:MAG TPA: GntR family transcriptional regulator [Mycobacterium sp.]|jgi:DNA-binding GntR family transcriptional regulator|nr:GntR family transcriptional regulator [Mycobacterium sp.]